MHACTNPRIHVCVCEQEGNGGCRREEEKSEDENDGREKKSKGEKMTLQSPQLPKHTWHLCRQNMCTPLTNEECCSQWKGLCFTRLLKVSQRSNERHSTDQGAFNDIADKNDKWAQGHGFKFKRHNARATRENSAWGIIGKQKKGVISEKTPVRLQHTSQRRCFLSHQQRSFHGQMVCAGAAIELCFPLPK